MKGLKDSNYTVVINHNISKVNTKKDVWEIIGHSPIGSCYSVYNKKGEIPSEFVPF
ncbi:MAG: hypothetical protein JJV88_05670 [Sulfurovum sp.]|nr:hypothetical protein [Sulfurovaceae bacterium]